MYYMYCQFIQPKCKTKLHQEVKMIKANSQNHCFPRSTGTQNLVLWTRMTLTSDIVVYLTFPFTPVQLHPHAHRPFLFAEGDKADPFGYDRWRHITHLW